MKGRNNPGDDKVRRKGSWKVFGSFFRKVKLSWGLIILSLVISIAIMALFLLCLVLQPLCMPEISAWQPLWAL